MNANITEDELRILTHLHEHAVGYERRFAFFAPDLAKYLEMSIETMDKLVSYLAGHGLVGVYAYGTTRVSDVSLRNRHITQDVWLTHLGEDYMRELEKQPGMPKKLTLAALKTTGQAGLDIATKVLTSLVMMRMVGHI